MRFGPIITPRGGFPLICPIAAPRATVARRAIGIAALCAVLGLYTTGCRSGGSDAATPAPSLGHVATASDKAQAMNRYVDGLRAYHAGDKAAARTAFMDATA